MVHAENRVAVDWAPSERQLGITARNTSLTVVLSEVQQATGWDILLENGLDRAVDMRIVRRDATDCLTVLLKGLRYELTLNTGSVPRLVIYRKTLEAADEPVPEAEPVPVKRSAELVIQIKSESEAQRLARQFNADLAEFVKLIGAARFKFRNAEQAARARGALGRTPGVGFVDDVYEYPQPRAPTRVPTGVLPVRVKPTETVGDGSLIIGLVDTAVQETALDRPGFILESKSAVETKAPPAQGAPTHGTAMASIMLRGLSNKDLKVDESSVRILPVNVFNENGTTTSLSVASGIAMAIESGATIINLSLGGKHQSRVVKQVLEEGNRRGILFVGAAGNEPVTTPTYPAAHSEVMAITAKNLKGDLANYANRGDFVDVAEIGMQPVRFRGATYAVQGTSSASAYIAGMAAALMSQHGKSVIETREMIIKNRPFVRTPAQD